MRFGHALVPLRIGLGGRSAGGMRREGIDQALRGGLRAGVKARRGAKPQCISRDGPVSLCNRDAARGPSISGRTLQVYGAVRIVNDVCLIGAERTIARSKGADGAGLGGRVIHRGSVFNDERIGGEDIAPFVAGPESGVQIAFGGESLERSKLAVAFCE